jgi:hypothetical protein
MLSPLTDDDDDDDNDEDDNNNNNNNNKTDFTNKFIGSRDTWNKNTVKNDEKMHTLKWLYRKLSVLNNQEWSTLVFTFLYITNPNVDARNFLLV